MTAPAAASGATLGDLVIAVPGAAPLFERLRLDYCCGGAVRLDDACRRRGLDAETVLTMLDALSREPHVPARDPHLLSTASFRELCEHIVVRHHGPLRVALTRITKLMDTVARVHGSAQPELLDLQHAFATLRVELEGHLDLEERTLFPACARLDGVLATPAPDDELLAHLREDHASVGAALSTMRELCADYDSERALCGTHRELLRSLHAFELDMHQHVHEENNVLFPRVLAHVRPQV
jgi:regulator of cell morphogenesis and NO signaling